MDVTVDNLGNVIIVGYTKGNLDSKTLTGITDAFIIKYSASGMKQWTKLIGASGGDTAALAVSTDESRNIFFTGYTTAALPSNQQLGSYDLFVAKYNESGDQIWIKQIGIAGEITQGSDITIGSSGNPIVVGTTSGDLFRSPKVGDSDFFLIEYNSIDGTQNWIKQSGVSGKATYGNALAVSATGEIYITGWSDGSLDETTQTQGKSFCFLQKYNEDPTHTLAWTKMLGDSTAQNTIGLSIALDATGNSYIAGYTEGSLYENSKKGTSDGFTAKYDSDGNRTWIDQVGDTNSETRFNQLRVKSNGEIFISGSTFGSLGEKFGSPDAFILKYKTNGSRDWINQFGVPGKITDGFSLALDLSGDVYIAGYTQGALVGTAPYGTFDFYIKKYNNSGTAY